MHFGLELIELSYVHFAVSHWCMDLFVWQIALHCPCSFTHSTETEPYFFQHLIKHVSLLQDQSHRINHRPDLVIFVYSIWDGEEIKQLINFIYFQWNFKYCWEKKKRVFFNQLVSLVLKPFQIRKKKGKETKTMCVVTAGVTFSSLVWNCCITQKSVEYSSHGTSFFFLLFSFETLSQFLVKPHQHQPEQKHLDCQSGLCQQVECWGLGFFFIYQ